MNEMFTKPQTSLLIDDRRRICNPKAWFPCKASRYQTAQRTAKDPDKVFEQVYRLFGCCICPFGFSATVSMPLMKEVAKGKKSKVFQKGKPNKL